jgi:hypothetical protein
VGVLGGPRAAAVEPVPGRHGSGSPPDPVPFGWRPRNQLTPSGAPEVDLVVLGDDLGAVRQQPPLLAAGLAPDEATGGGHEEAMGKGRWFGDSGWFWEAGRCAGSREMKTMVSGGGPAWRVWWPLVP